MIGDWKGKQGYRLSASVSEVRPFLFSRYWEFYSMIYNDSEDSDSVIEVYREKFSAMYYAEEMCVWARSYFPRKQKEPV